METYTSVVLNVTSRAKISRYDSHAFLNNLLANLTQFSDCTEKVKPKMSILLIILGFVCSFAEGITSAKVYGYGMTASRLASVFGQRCPVHDFGFLYTFFVSVFSLLLHFPL